MKKRWIAAGLAAVTACSVFISGCGDDKKAAADKIVRVAGTVSVSSSSMDPAKGWDGWYIVRYGVGETLFKVGDGLKIEPWLAEKFEKIDDLTWKITLKKNVTFSNGEAMTPQKVIDSLKRVGDMNERAGFLKTAVYTVDGDAVVIKTEKPRLTLINDLADPYATIIDVANTKDFEKAPIGTGPFVMASYESNKKAVMKKNPKYWGGEVKSDGVEYTKVTDANALAMSLQGGEVDIAQDLTVDAAENIAKKDNLVVKRVAQPRVYQMYFNLNKMQDKAVREAIMYGVNKKDIGEKLMKGAVSAAYSAFPDDSAYGAKNLKPRMFDAAKAKQILADAGYKDTNGDGIVEKDGKPLTVQFSVYKRAAIAPIATEMQAQLKQIGIDVQIKNFEKATFFAPGDFDIALYYVVTMPVGDPYDFLYNAYDKDSKVNFGHYNNPEVQEWLEELQKLPDGEARMQLVHKIQQAVIDDAAMDFVGFNTIQVGMGKNVKGYLITPNDYYQVTKDLEK
jgi:peptide/nickel transport system substrate-binding protein